MEKEIINDIFTIVKKVNEIQDKLLDKNNLVGLISLKIIIKYLESLLEKLKQKDLEHSSITFNNIEELLNKYKKLKKFRGIFFPKKEDN